MVAAQIDQISPSDLRVMQNRTCRISSCRRSRTVPFNLTCEFLARLPRTVAESAAFDLEIPSKWHNLVEGRWCPFSKGKISALQLCM